VIEFESNNVSRHANIEALKRSLASASEPTLKDRLQVTIERLIKLYANDKPIKQDDGDMKKRKPHV
jgi:hypothetical protein